jgi:hypothetical protein
MNEPSDSSDFEAQVESLAAQFRYPPTPGLLALHRRREVRLPRLAWVLVALVAVAVAVPPVRAAVGEILRVGAVRIVQGGQVETPDGALTVLDLPGETTLDAARRDVSFEIRTPQELAAPDRAFLLDIGAPSVALVWLEQDVPALVLYTIPSSPVVTKLMPQTLDNAVVDGHPATWVTGEHTLELLIDGQPMRIEVRGNVLIWTDGILTYRLETSGPLAEAVRIAESLNQPVR